MLTALMLFSVFTLVFILFVGLVRWNDARSTAGLFRAEINAVLETVIASDHVGSLFGYQGHLAAGNKMAIPTYLCCQASELPIFRQFRRRMGLFDPELSCEIAAFYVVLAQARRCFVELAAAKTEMPEVLAEGLAEDIRLWKRVEVQGSSVADRLQKFIMITPQSYLSALIFARAPDA